MERRSFDEFAVKLDYGDAFRFEHLMNVFFYTSNTGKLLQVRVMFSRAGFELKQYKGSRDYDDYSFDR
jgi:hypothetical protein